MKTVAVIFGGRRTEHDISIISALQVLNNLDSGKYNIMPIYIDNDGRFFVGKKLYDLNFFKNIDYKKLKEVAIMSSSNFVFVKRHNSFVKWKKLDFVFIVLHGLNGEDGTIQGLFELNGIAYSSCGVLASALSMDKVAMKIAFKGLDLPILPYVWFYYEDYQTDENIVINRLEKELKYPMIVKPANLGSSIGITVCKTKNDLTNAIEIAGSFDQKIVVERAIEKLKEINISCMGLNDQVELSVTEEPINWKSFLSFSDKYMKSGTVKRRMPAIITLDMEASILEMAKKVFTNFFCKGIVRIDFMLDEDENKIYLNEINTIPGSLAFFLWKDRNYNFKSLLDKNIEYVVKDQASKKKLNYQYNSGILKNVGSGYKKK